MNKSVLENLPVPPELKRPDGFASLTEWEDKVLGFFSGQYKMFTPYPDYFKLRTYEFRILRQLLSRYFDPSQPYPSLLEIGCNFGFKSILLSVFAKRVLAVDIPESYAGCHLGSFQRTTDIAKILVNERFAIDNVEFENMWPDKLTVDSQSVDCIFTEYVLEHIPDLSEAIKEMARVLKVGGVMIHTVPNTKDAVRDFLDANIKITFKQAFKIFKSQWGAILRNQSRNQPCMRLTGVV
ncbi:MAG: class I SAM-dependent methyltransferase, partial [Candidatus Omnitrophica bacterium]|nr:class I SAM-dependent methyltransferase [Candidatus Omnitrophota bacterium]